MEKQVLAFSAYSNQYSIYTTGKSMPALLNNAIEATELYFEEKQLVLKPGDILFELDFQQFFQYYRVLNAKFLAERIGMNASLLSQYVKG